jgi:hypothetical protein
VDNSFDPYRKWLGIPPEEQPPHHYRLLGLELFEADPDVIVNAADARLSYLRSLSKDQHADMADRIAAQIKEVQLCLLDPAKKAFYDGQLQRRIAAMRKETPPVAIAGPSPADSTLATGEKWTSPLPQPPQAATTRPATAAAETGIPALRVPTYLPRVAPPTRKRWQMLAAMALGLVAVGCVVVALLTNFKRDDKTTPSLPIVPSVVKDDSPRDTKTGGSPKAPETVTETPASRKPEESSHVETKMPPQHGQPHEPVVAADDGSGRNGSDSELPALEPAERPREIRRPRKPISGDGTATADVSTARPKDVNKRKPRPPEAERQAAEKSVRELYASKKAAAKSPAERIALCDQIWAEAVDGKRPPAEQYALFSIAFQWLCETGRLQKEIDRADAFAEVFEIDPWDLKAQAVASTVKLVQTALATHANPLNLDAADIFLNGRQFAEDAKEAGQAETAQRMVKAITPLAKLDATLMRDFNAFAREVDKQAIRYQPVRKARDALKEHPDDGDALTVVGRWTCFESHDWDAGLPMLAKSSDAVLAKFAARDTVAAKNDAAEQMAVADGWWDFAQKEKEKSAAKAAALSRAEYWYDRALPELSEADKAKADERLKSLSGLDATPDSGRGAIQAGNVALAKNGTTVEGVRYNDEKLLDGDRRNPSWDGDAANSPVPCEWTITFDKVYQLRQIRFHFYDGDARFYHYAMAVSSDGVNYKPLVDRNQGQSFRWQIIPLSGMPVKSVKLFGTYAYRNRAFAVTEFEAYCIPPKP